MLISEYFDEGIRQRGAIFRLKMYLSGKDVDYRIFYNVAGLEKKIDECPEFPEKFDYNILRKMHTSGFFKDNSYVVVQINGKLQEYRDIKSAVSMNQNFVDEYKALRLQERYLDFISEGVTQLLTRFREESKQS